MAPLFLLSLLLLLSSVSPSPLSLEIHDRFSDRVRQWAESTGHPGTWWPKHGSVEYYDALSHHDRRLHHRRSLATLTTDEELAFVDGNATYRFSSLGYLYYAEVALGTPNVSFLVALDTGSDLFWVPCDCKQCAPLTSSLYGNLKFMTYDPKKSNTSENISCGSSQCDDVQSSCSGSEASCTYKISYLSDNTSSSGMLVEDVLYLTTETAQQKTMQASIVFGCGENQTGTFLDGGAPNGLMGLSMSNLSVPSILSNKGFTANSFSMCFSEDGVGRINFGDRGSEGQSEADLNLENDNSLYNVSFMGIKIENASISSSFSVIVDSGTSFTYLDDPMYTDFVTNFNSQVDEQRISASSSFEYCYALSPGQQSVNLPNIIFITKSGSSFPINDPIITILSTAETPVAYCLAVLKSSNFNILGQNFMTGLRVVFDRERLILGWTNFDCYKSAPGPALAPYSFNPQDNSQVNHLNNSSPFRSSGMSSLGLLLAAFLLFIRIH
ncbi:hypothetical protein LUZ60_011918 [Juncus effusus]|nr:hypothetical protein LUZ60_011918 [Juncus effusus]